MQQAVLQVSLLQVVQYLWFQGLSPSFPQGRLPQLDGVVFTAPCPF